MSKVQELKSSIEKLEKAINSPATPEGMKSKLKEKLEKAKSDLSEAEKAEEKPKDEKKEKSKKKAGAKRKNIAVIGGKEFDMDSREFCDALLAQYKRRHADAKKNKMQAKTTPVFSQITTKISSGVAKAIKTSVSENKAEIKKNPEKYIEKYEKLAKSAAAFAQEFKSVMGDDYKSTEIDDLKKELNAIIEKIEKLAVKKKD